MLSQKCLGIQEYLQILYRKVHTGLKQGNEPDPVFLIVPVPFLVPVQVPGPCIVNKPLQPVFKSLLLRLLTIPLIIVISSATPAQ